MVRDGHGRTGNGNDSEDLGELHLEVCVLEIWVVKDRAENAEEEEERRKKQVTQSRIEK